MIAISETLAKRLRAALSTGGKDLLYLGSRPQGGYMYHEAKGNELIALSKTIDKKIKQNETRLRKLQ